MTLDLNHYKTLLEAEAETLEKELSSIGVQSQTNPDDWKPNAGDLNTDATDPNVAADAYEEAETNAGISNELEARLKSVHNALARIEAGTYGVCEISGEPIEEARLEANPAARTCIAHKDETPQ